MTVDMRTLGVYYSVVERLTTPEEQLEGVGVKLTEISGGAFSANRTPGRQRVRVYYSPLDPMSASPVAILDGLLLGLEVLECGREGLFVFHDFENDRVIVLEEPEHFDRSCLHDLSAFVDGLRRCHDYADLARMQPGGA